MPPTNDIRHTGTLDNFDRPADEIPIEPPWYMVSGSANINLDATHSSIEGTVFPPDSSLAWYSAASFYGPSVEMWATMAGSAALTDGWRFGMYTTDSLTYGGANVNGYQCIPWAAIGGTEWALRRYDNGVYTGLGAVSAGMVQDDIALMRRNGNNIETWRWSVASDTWTKINDVTDTTYMYGPWSFILGTTGVETGWKDLGGGLKNRQMIYRWIVPPS
jgi:hypothetical protein